MIASIELAILAHLKAASDSGLLGYKWSALETYPEDWDQYLKDKTSLKGNAAWTTFAGWSLIDTNGGLRVAATFGLVIMAESLRNEQASRHGDPVDETKPGSYQLILDSAALLHGQRLGLDIDTIKVGACRFVRSIPARMQQGASMLAIELQTGFSIELLADLDDFAAAHMNWDVPAFANIAFIPADAEADATDHLLLETAP